MSNSLFPLGKTSNHEYVSRVNWHNIHNIKKNMFILISICFCTLIYKKKKNNILSVNSCKNNIELQRKNIFMQI